MDKTQKEIIYKNEYCPHVFDHFHNSYMNSHFETIRDVQKEPKHHDILFTNFSILSNPALSKKYFRYNEAQNIMSNFFLNNLTINWVVLNNSQNLSFSSINREGCIFTLSFDDEGTTMASSNHNHNHNIEIWDLKTKKLKKVISEHKEIVTGIEYFHKRDDLFLSCSLDKTIKLWKDYKNVHTFIEHSDWVRCIAINQDNTKFLSGCVSSVVKLWDLNTQRVIASLTNKNPDPSSLSTVNSLCFMKSNENVFLSGFRSGEIKLYDTRMKNDNGGLGISQAFKAHKGKLNSIKLNSTENYLLSSGRESILRLWDMRNLPNDIDNFEPNKSKCLNEYKGHKCTGYNIDSNFYAREKYLITGSEDSNIYIYNIVTSEIAFKIKTHQKCINLIRPIPKTYASFACTGLEDISILIWDFSKNISKGVEKRFADKFNKPLDDENDDSFDESKFDDKESSQQICSRLVEDIMSECGDMILKIFHSHNLTYSNGINFETLMEIIQKSKDQESMRILNMINEKFIKRLMENLVNGGFEQKKKKAEKKPKIEKKTVVKTIPIKCAKCLKKRIQPIEKVNENFDLSLLDLPDCQSGFNCKTKEENEDEEIKKTTAMKSIYSETTDSFKESTILLNKFL